MTALYFDIETGPLPEEQLRKSFRELTLEEYIESCPSNWKRETAVAKYPEANAKAWQDYVGKAALHPLTGRVVAIGLMTPQQDKPDIIDCDFWGGNEMDGHERDGLIDFWQEVEDALENHMALVGFNICGFDLPFLIRRSWLLGLCVPMGLRKGRYWSDAVIDLMDRWGFGRDMVKLDALAKAFGLAGKVSQGEDGTAVSGADFHRLWRENRPLAEKYLRQDVQLCYQLGEAMGGV